MNWRKVVHHGLDHLAGVWSEADFLEFMEALRKQRPIVPAMWE
jgi:hypothetical protein